MNCEIALVLGWRMENLISLSSVIPGYLIIKKMYVVPLR